jgi:hypothetical protein
MLIKFKILTIAAKISVVITPSDRKVKRTCVPRTMTIYCEGQVFLIIECNPNNRGVKS